MALSKAIHRFKEIKWGSWSLISLYISLLSGIVIGIQYNPAQPYHSITSIDLLVPFGAFFRSLHFYSSQFFFLFTIAHFLAAHDETESYSQYRWLMLMSTFPVIVFLLFTGYVLRDDNTGFAAGMIAESILLNIPLIGSSINTLLFSITEHGMQRVYLHHVISLDILLLILAWDHLRRYRIKIRDNTALLFVTVLFCIFIGAPLEPEKLGTTYISGPWFFLGLQELLRYLHPLVAGVLFPLAFLGAVLCLHKENRYYRYALRFTLIWLFSYLVLTLIAWIR